MMPQGAKGYDYLQGQLNMEIKTTSLRFHATTRTDCDQNNQMEE